MAENETDDNYFQVILTKKTLQKSFIFFIPSGVLFAVLGIVMVKYYKEIEQVRFQYEDCTCIGTPCITVQEFQIGKDMAPPIYLYYELKNFYQNYRSYMNSKSNEQLAGEEPSKNDLDSCSPVITYKDLVDIGKRPLNQNITDYLDKPANPCGMIAKTVFNDTFALFRDNESIPINEKNLAYDYEYSLYKRPENWEDKQWTDVTDDHFIIWMRIAPTNRFRKLWGKIETELKAGQYRLQINNNYNISVYDGQKFFVMSTSNAFGQKNLVLILTLFVAAFINISLVIVLSYVYLKNKKKKDA